MIFKLESGDANMLTKVMKHIMGLEEGTWIIEITKKRKLASMKQRGYYHGVLCLAIAVHLGMEVEDVHEHIKLAYNPKRIVIKSTGEEIVIGGSTSAFDTKQYTELIDKVRSQFLVDIELFVPVPQEVTNDYILNLKTIYQNRFHT